MFEYIADLSWTFWASLVVSIIVAVYFISKQTAFNRSTMMNLLLYKDFFKKKEKYDTIEELPEHVNLSYDSEKEAWFDENGVEETAIKKVIKLRNNADSKAELHSLIEDINEYLGSCKGTATFEIIQNKTERRITKLYDKATSKASFPTHFGLMGTFVGVFLGLGMFLLGSMIQGGITDDAIHSLILGVLVSMSTSFIGLRMSTRANDLISDAKTKIDEDKNEFYEFVQNRLMTSVNISLTEALGNLHQTVSDFEPSFSKVIKGFKETFEACTKAFGKDFNTSVTTMVDAVGTMSANVNQITQNVSLLENLLNRLSGAEWTTYMRQFADTNEHFKTLTQSLNDFERARRMMLAATQEAINIQKTYNDSLVIPRQVATEINGILQRVVNFEKSINALGEELASRQVLGNAVLDEIKEQITAIKKKHKIAEQYIETADNKLEMFFDSQLIELKRLETKYQEALVRLFEAYENITDDHKEEINQRHQMFKDAIDDKFELTEVRSDLSNLKKIPTLEKKVDEVKSGQQQLRNTNEDIRRELNALNAAKEEENKSIVGRMISGGNSAYGREIERQRKENERLQLIIQQAKIDRETEQALKERLKAEHTDTSPVNQQNVESTNQSPELGPEKKTIWGRIFGR